jgi:hypothetical protein
VDERDFVVTFPLYLIVIGPRAQPLTCVSEDTDEECRAIALFTEELLAERNRDHNAPIGEIWKIDTFTEFKTRYLPLFMSWGYQHVAIDPHEETGKGPFCPIEDFFN